MTKRKVTTDDLREMMRSRKTLSPLYALNTDDCWYPVVESYRMELLYRELTRLRREKALLRAALKDVLDMWERWHGYRPRWSQGILDKTEDAPK